MGAIRTSSSAIWPKNKPAPAGVRQQAQALRKQYPAVSSAFEFVQSEIDSVLQTLRSELPPLEDFYVTGPSGQVICRIGSDADADGSYRGLFLYDLDGVRRGWAGVQEQAEKDIEDLTDNGSGLIRVTITAHGYKDKDTVKIRNAAGVTAANGSWIITLIDADTFDLATNVVTGTASAFSGVFGSAGTAKRYYAGLLTEQIGIGTTFDTAHLRGYADGSLELNGATFRLAIGDIVTTIDKNVFGTNYVGVKVADSTSDKYTAIHSGGLIVVDADDNNNLFAGTSMGHGYISLLDGGNQVVSISAGSSGSLAILGPTGGNRIVLGGDPGYISVEDHYSIGMNTVIDSSRKAYFTELDINGSTRISSSGNVNSANGASSTVLLAPITPGGTNGSITTVGGIVTSMVAPG